MKSDKCQVTGDTKRPRSSASTERRHTPPRHSSFVIRHSSFAFTLIELLVVISIMGLIAALAVPALKNMGKANVQASGTRQMLDDIGRARQLAITEHTTVYMVFVPSNYINLININGHNIEADLTATYLPQPTDYQYAWMTMSNLEEKQLTGYNFISLGQVGDQPGQHIWHYLSTWQSLPEGTFIAAAKFLPRYDYTAYPQWQAYTAFPALAPPADYAGQIDNWFRYGTTLEPQIIGFTNYAIPFPTEKCPQVFMPCLAFDDTGRLVSEYDGYNYHHAYIPLAQGSVISAHDANKKPVLSPMLPSDISEIPPGNSTNISYNIIDVDPLSGRAHVLNHHMP
jgi:prepilin-type N-terminal cleavage/methylation domain-containing protein